MRFNSNSETLMNLMFPLYEETIKENKNNSKPIVQKKHYERILKHILKDISSSHIIIEKLKKTKEYSQSLETIQHKTKADIPKPGFFNSSHFLPDSIKQYILEHATKYLLYKCKIGERQFNVYFTLFDNDEDYSKYDNYATLVFVWLKIASVYSTKKCAQTLNLYIYPVESLHSSFSIENIIR